MEPPAMHLVETLVGSLAWAKVSKLLYTMTAMLSYRLYEFRYALTSFPSKESLYFVSWPADCAMALAFSDARLLFSPCFPFCECKMSVTGRRYRCTRY